MKPTIFLFAFLLLTSAAFARPVCPDYRRPIPEAHVEPNRALSAALLRIMLAAVPPGSPVHGAPPSEGMTAETVEAQEARYAEIADAITDVSLDPKERPLNGSRSYTAAMLLSVSYMESMWRRDIDNGATRGDGGSSCGPWQMNIGRHGRTPEGWSCADILSDRKKAARAALGALRRSAGACHGDEVAAMYAFISGGCHGDMHPRNVFGGRYTVREIAAKRVRLAQRWLARIEAQPAPPLLLPAPGARAAP